MIESQVLHPASLSNRPVRSEEKTRQRAPLRANIDCTRFLPLIKGHGSTASRRKLCLKACNDVLDPFVVLLLLSENVVFAQRLRA